MSSAERRQGAKLVAVGILWLVAARLLADFGAYALPAALRRHLTLQSYGSLVLIVATLLGLLLTRALITGPWRSLGLLRAPPWPLVAAGLLAPLVLAVSAYIAFRVALPTLLEEIARGGRAAAERNTGAFGRAIVTEHAAVTLLWAVVITPVAEELAFRGALWGGITTLTSSSGAPGPQGWAPRRGVAARMGTLLRRGGVATLVTAAVFAWMHADQPGGAGIVRVVQTGVLGVALGVARQVSGSLAPPMLLHAVFNALTIAKSRAWVVGEVWPHPLPIPWWWWQLALLGGAVATAGTLHRWRPALAVKATRFRRGAPPTTVAAFGADLRAELEADAPWWGHLDGEPTVTVDPEGDGTEVVVVCMFRPHSGLLLPAAWLGRRATVHRLRRWLAHV